MRTWDLIRELSIDGSEEWLADGRSLFRWRYGSVVMEDRGYSFGSPEEVLELLCDWSDAHRRAPSLQQMDETGMWMDSVGEKLDELLIAGIDEISAGLSENGSAGAPESGVIPDHWPPGPR